MYIAVPPAVGHECWMAARLCTYYQFITPKPDTTTDDNQPILGAIVQYTTSCVFDLVDFTRVKRSTQYPCRATHGGHVGANWYAATKLTGVINDQIFIRWEHGGMEEWLPSAQVTKLQKQYSTNPGAPNWPNLHCVLRGNPEWAKLSMNNKFGEVTKEEKNTQKKERKARVRKVCLFPGYTTYVHSRTTNGDYGNSHGDKKTLCTMQ